MPAIIKIVIHIKLIVVVLFLHQTNGLRNQSFKHATLPQYAQGIPGITDDNIIMKWMNAEVALKKAYFNLFRSLLSTSFGWHLTSNVSQNCSNSLLEYLNGLRNKKTWAFKMFDASGKVPNGIFGGNPMAFGDFDTCLEIESPSRKFQGQHCLIELELPLPERILMSPIEEPVEGIHNLFEPNTIADHLAKHAKYFYNSQLRLTACLPSTCSEKDITALFYKIQELLETNEEVRVHNCEVKQDLKFTDMEIFIYALFSFLICLVVLGTLLDIFIRNNSKHDFETTNKSAAVKVLLCFSAYTNSLSLLKIDNNPDNLHIFHGLRVLSMTWIIWSHSYLVVSYRAFDGTLYRKDLPKEFFFQMVPCGFLAVENFFFMSSVILSYICVRMRGKISMPLLFLMKYLRLTPTMMLVVGFFAIIGRFGSGPLWKETVAETLSKNCLERGWLNLFYINNFLYSPKTCLGWTWYLSTDTQLFIVSLYVCVIMKRRRRRGFLLAGLVIIIGVLLAAFSHLYYGLPPTYLQSYMNFDDWYYYAVKGYTQAHFHLPVCAVGLIVGYILATKRGRIPKNINSIGWFLSFLTFLTMFLLTYKWNQGMEALPNLFVSALYGSTHRLAWSLCLAFITLSCTWGQGGIIGSILSWQGFVPFARLTYMVYLVHYGLMYIYTGSIRQSMLIGHRTLIFIFLNNILLSFLTAFVLGLFFETPFMVIEKTFFGGRLKKDVLPVSAVNGTVILKNAV